LKGVTLSLLTTLSFVIPSEAALPRLAVGRAGEGLQFRGPLLEMFF